MFLHNLKYTIKNLFKNKILIFWTFAFPILLGLFFNMAFSNIENDETLKVFDIAVVNDNNFKQNEIYVKTLKELSSKKNKDRLFNIKYVNKSKADKLLDGKKIEGYLWLENEKSNLVFKSNGVNQTIMKFVVEEIEENKKIANDLVPEEMKKGNKINPNEIATNIINKRNNNEIKLNNISNSNLSYMVIEYYTLIAMACMYGGMLSMTALNQNLANMSKKGRRIAIAPTKKSVIALSSTIGSYIVSLVGIALLMLFLIFVLDIDFGTNTGLIVLLAVVGDLAGISLGILVASLFKVSEGAKTGIIISVSMLFSVLSGMMGVTLKYVIDKNIPILNMINPNSLITDGFYSLYYYDSIDRYFSNVLYLLIFSFICIFVSSLSLRSDRYDSI